MYFNDDNDSDEYHESFPPHMSMGGSQRRHGGYHARHDRSTSTFLPWSNGSVLDHICTVILPICLVLGGLVKAGVIKPSSDPSRATSITYAQGMPSSRPSSGSSSQTQQDATDSASSDSSDSTGLIGYRYDSSDQYRQYVNEIKAMHDKYHAMPAAQINEYVKALPDAQSAIDTWLKTLDHMLEATSYGDARRSMNRDAATTYYMRSSRTCISSNTISKSTGRTAYQSRRIPRRQVPISKSSSVKMKAITRHHHNN